MREAFSKPAHAARPRVGPPGANHGPFAAKPSSCHVHSTLRVTPPTSPCATLSADAEPARQRAETIFSAQCAVWRYQKCTIGFKGLKSYQFPSRKPSCTLLGREYQLAVLKLEALPSCATFQHLLVNKVSFLGYKCTIMVDSDWISNACVMCACLLLFLFCDNLFFACILGCIYRSSRFHVCDTVVLVKYLITTIAWISFLWLIQECNDCKKMLWEANRFNQVPYYWLAYMQP